MNGERQEQFAIDRLNELRQAMQGEGCSRDVRAFVLDQFERERARTRRIWQRPFVWRIAAAAACAVLIATIMMRQPAGEPHPTPERVAKATTASSAVEPQKPGRPSRAKPAPPVRVAVSKPRVRRRTPPARAETAVAPREALPEIATEFLALPYAPPLYPDEGAEVVRVRLPRSAMRSFGLPVSEERLYERVPADVILGQDGIARAVRFVKVAQ